MNRLLLEFREIVVLQLVVECAVGPAAFLHHDLTETTFFRSFQPTINFMHNLIFLVQSLYNSNKRLNFAQK